MTVSQKYKYLPVMIAEKAEEVVKKLLHEIILRFGLPKSLKVIVGHHLLLRSPKGSLKHWAFLIISIVPGGLSLWKK